MSQQRPPQVPNVYRLIRDAGGQSETFGVLLLLGITVVGTTAVVTFGSTALTDIEQASELQRTEQAMTLMDSRAAMVALGDSDQQEVTLSGSGGGNFEVKEGTGWMRITHVNQSTKGHDEVIYNRSLGRVVYENGNEEIAYQGGGVWRHQEDGRSVMVSKPEFHYRSATLTLPVVRVHGSSQAAGTVTAKMSSMGESRRVYPNDSMTVGSDEVGAPYNETRPGATRPYSNPIENGTVEVTVSSRYYEAWADYFRTRTSANVSVYDGNQTVHMELLTLSDIGDFDTLADDLEVGGYPDGHHLTNFTTTLVNDKDGSGTFKSLHWSFYVDKGSEKFEMHVTPNDKCDQIEGGSGTIDISYFYENASSGQSQEWQNENVDIGSDAIEGIDCDADPERITVNFTATNTDLTYEAIDGVSTAKHAFADSYGDVGSASFDRHDEDGAASVDPYRPGSGHQENMSFVLNHYFALLGPNFDLQGTEGPGGSSRIDEDASSGTLTYNQEGASFLTYLHVTENDVRVELD